MGREKKTLGKSTTYSWTRVVSSYSSLLSLQQTVRWVASAVTPSEHLKSMHLRIICILKWSSSLYTVGVWLKLTQKHEQYFLTHPSSGINMSRCWGWVCSRRMGTWTPVAWYCLTAVCLPTKLPGSPMWLVGEQWWWWWWRRGVWETKIGNFQITIKVTNLKPNNYFPLRTINHTFYMHWNKKNYY